MCLSAPVVQAGQLEMETDTTQIQQLRFWSPIIGFAILLIWESLLPFFDLFRNGLNERTVHLVRNLIIGELNVLMVSFGFVAIWWWAAALAETHSFGILYWLGLDSWLRICAALLILDFWMYWWHWMNHRLSFFWRFHRIHHSDREMDVTTCVRFHIGEVFFSSLFRIGVILLGGLSLWEVFLYEVFLNLTVQFHHANIGLGAIDRAIRVFIVSPAMHKVHHSQVQIETDSNYTSLLSVWDRIFGTFRLRDDPEAIRFGLESVDARTSSDLFRLVRLPLVRKDDGSGPS